MASSIPGNNLPANLCQNLIIFSSAGSCLSSEMSHWLSAVLSSLQTMSSVLFEKKQSISLIFSHFHFLLALAAQAYALKEENDSLRWQLDAYRNEVELLKQEKGQLFRTEESLTKDQQLQFLQQTMQGMQQVLLRKKRTGLLFWESGTMGLCCTRDYYSLKF